MEQSLIFALTYICASFMLTISCIASAKAIAMTANATLGALRKKPDVFSKAMILTALPSTQGLYGFAAFFFIFGALRDLTVLSWGAALPVMATAIALGSAGIYVSVCQGKILSNGLNDLGNGADVFSKTLILAAFPELYAILPFALTFIALP